MTDFQSEYIDSTKTIDDIVSTQVSSVLTWSNIPGGLTKVVSSSAGFAWGYNGNNQVWSCKLPCSGDWSYIDLSSFKISSIQDLIVDDNDVYILITTDTGTHSMVVGPASTSGSWNPISLPFAATHLFSTHTFIWAQDASNVKQRCAKPCTMSNWIKVSDTSVKITSSSTSSLYGVDSKGNAMKSDETLQTGWSPISGLSSSKFSSIIGDVDDSNLYGLDTTSKLLKYDGKQIQPVDIQGYTPANITIDPTSREMWMTTQTSGPLGNVFKRLESPDYTSILNNVNPLDRKRDEIVSDVEKEYSNQTNVMTVNKQVNDVVTYFKRIFNLDRSVAPKANAQAGHLQEQIKQTQTQLDNIHSLQPLIQKLVYLLLVVSAIYIIGSSFGEIIHLIALIVLSVGFYYILKSSQV